ncbi:sulfotransferase domain-containing protein [Aurantimonas manganoxydans]|uniref:Possible sulfotransferase family n=1 Tax=Aurantimonas manganoxydans TaxID=651183 RepID=A0A0P0Z5T1_9HYPH|nr:sulfotransferase domain-containing protein [Aurantimonas manganoxydans]BAT29452.1 possible sulfotransferase family [Aurantimonas manganoxydans SI85-9A1]
MNNESLPGSESDQSGVNDGASDVDALARERVALRRERDGYKNAYEELSAEVGTLRSERDGYKGAYEQLASEVGMLRSERDGYKGAYEQVEPRFNYLRMVAGPVTREEVAPTLVGKPSIFIVTLPKSGTVYIAHTLRQSLEYDFTSVMVTPTFPKNIVWESMAVDFVKGGMVSASHMAPDAINLAALKDAGIRKAVLHFRDPRAALASWFHFRTAYGQFPSERERLSRVAVELPESFLALSKPEQMDHFIESFYRPCIDWMVGWLDVIDRDPEFEVLLKTHDDLKGQETAYLQSILDFYEIDASSKLVEKSEATHFRKGDSTSWKADVTEAQAKRLADMIPEVLRLRFGWN